jgi:predicted amidohydrolase YtcJ
VNDPGGPARFRDAHTHLAAGAADLDDLDLRGQRTHGELEAALSDAARTRTRGSWIRGWGWQGAPPPRDATPAHPVFLARRDGHAAWLNPMARAALGLDDEEEVVREQAFDAARRRLPERSAAFRSAALGRRLVELRERGVDAVDDMVEAWAPEVYAALRDRGDLPAAVGMWLPEEIAASEALRLRREFPADDRRVAVRGIKIFLDGTLGARTAALSRPYADDPGNTGTLRVPEGEIQERVDRWAARGWPVALHAIGDRAVTLALTALERAGRPSFGGHRVEHAQVVRRRDLPRFAAAGIVASVQPGHWRDDRTWLSARLGERPEVVAHPLASLARTGATLLFGSDWPVSDWDPAVVLAAAVDPERGDEALAAAEASAWYTSRPR